MENLEKLGFTKYQHISLDHVPAPLSVLVDDLTVEPISMATDLRVVFALSLPEMKARINQVAADKQLAADGVVYLLYPKLASKQYQGIHRDALFSFLAINHTTGEIGSTGLKFSRMRSFNADFTMIDLRWLSAAPRRQTTSQRVSDYADRVQDLAQRLSGEPAAASYFSELTPGYQRGWARYVYSPKQAATQQTHFDQAVAALTAHQPTWAAYRAAQKHN